jgi:hypothetical protein
MKKISKLFNGFVEWLREAKELREEAFKKYPYISRY